MPFQSAPEVAEAVINYSAGSIAIANVLNYWLPGGYLQADLDALADIVDNSVGTLLLPFMSPVVLYDNVLVRGLSSIIDLSATSNTNSGVGTSGGTVPLPNNVSYCVTHRTGLTGRSARGRTYMPPITEADILGDNTVTTAYITGILAFFTSLTADALSAGWHFVILSRQTAGVVRPTAIHNDVIQTVSRNNVTDSQRGRLPSGH